MKKKVALLLTLLLSGLLIFLPKRNMPVPQKTAAVPKKFEQNLPEIKYSDSKLSPKVFYPTLTMKRIYPKEPISGESVYITGKEDPILLKGEYWKSSVFYPNMGDGINKAIYQSQTPPETGFQEGSVMYKGKELLAFDFDERERAGEASSGLRLEKDGLRYVMTSWIGENESSGTTISYYLFISDIFSVE